MMLAARAVPLVWLDQLWMVVIQEFSADDTTIGWVPYRIACAVSADPSQIVGLDDPTLWDQVQADIDDALGFDVVDSTGSAMPAMTTVQQQVIVPDALTFGSGAFATLTAAVGVTEAAVGSAVAQAEFSLNALGGSAVSGPAAGLVWMSSAATQSGNLANAVAANGLVGRIATNLANTST